MKYLDEELMRTALRAFAIFSGWIAAPIIAALFLGRWLDGRYFAKPWGTVTAVAIAFIITNIGMVIEARKLTRSMNATEKDTPQTKHDD